ncbi:MAG: hypothetical protein PVH31_02020 [Ectothiorhodospiraceae bacterium]|jgi:hypothetical protein
MEKPSRIERLMGKAVILGCALLFAQVVWVGVSGAVEAHNAAATAPQQSAQK